MCLYCQTRANLYIHIKYHGFFFIFTLRIFRWLQESPRISWVRFLRSLVFLLPLFQPPLVELSFSSRSTKNGQFRIKSKTRYIRYEHFYFFSLFKVHRRFFAYFLEISSNHNFIVASWFLCDVHVKLISIHSAPPTPIETQFHLKIESFINKCPRHHCLQ